MMLSSSVLRLALIGTFSAGLGCSSGEPGRLGGGGGGGGSDQEPGTGAGGGGGSDLPAPPVSVVGGTGAAPSLPLPSKPPPAAPPLEGDVLFSPPSRTFVASLEVELSSLSSGVELRYTTDGSVPGPSSQLYDGEPIVLSGTTQLRAQAFTDGSKVGQVGTALYIARSFDAVSDLPIVLVDGYGGGKPEDRDVYADMAFMVFEPEAGAAALSNAPDLATRAGYHLRGQSSATFEQAPYRVELWNNDSEDADHPLLGMPAEADWALIGTFVDRSLIRNAFVYDLGRELGLAAPRYAFAEVYLNYEDRPLEPGDYQGIYMVVETIKNHPDRLNLKQLREEDTAPEQLSGGYIFKFDWAASEPPTLTCTGSPPLSSGFGPGGPGGGGGTCWTDLEVVDPEPLAPEQAAWLTSYVQQFHDALHEASFAEYSQQMNVRSFVDVFIINELTRNLDAYTRSAYYFKERDQPLTAGPLWDFNLILGVGFQTSLETEGFQFEERRAASDWYRILGVDPEFRAEVVLRWQELRAGLLSDAALQQRIDALTEPLAAAAARDFERWPVAVAAESLFTLPSAPTWEGQLDAMRDWLSERLIWLDSTLQ